ncbi:MAG: decarboxylating NADP(+)-dependent phosphogluconate dehydrogenase [Clostridia bacterium]|nr:decarboxylating NADP(+)-dependent phosphogluconate dehydrogenase [Clostridia bacterium]
MELSDIAMIGLAVMGENLSLNMERHGFRVSVFDVRDGIVPAFINGRGAGKNFYGASSFADVVGSLKKPRVIMMMIRAGKPVDEVIDKLLPLLEPGDIVIDGGNSHFPDPVRRCEYVESKGCFFIGTGVSGGEEGAFRGPSMMPGGSREAWERARPILQSICAKTESGEVCCDYVGENGAGHFVKMVHNGIEYGDMQLICEVYQIMKDQLGMSNSEMKDVFSEWNKGKLESYLIEITADILGYKDGNGAELIDYILDAAGQKGTGKWASIAALDEGIPLTLICEAVFARSLSADKDGRVRASELLSSENEKVPVSVGDLENALYAAKLISYAQGYSLMKAAADTYGWNLNYGGIALMWRGGCIIRSSFLGKIRDAFAESPELGNLMLAPYFRSVLKECEKSLRRVCSAAIMSGTPVPAFSAALAYFDGYRCARLPANLLQAQRDYFGAHTYERTDAPRGEHFHTNWTHEGADTASTFYNV